MTNQEYIEKVQKEVASDLQNSVNKLSWKMIPETDTHDSHVLLRVEFKDGSNHVFQFEDWRFAMKLSYLSSDVDIIVDSVVNYMKANQIPPYEDDTWEFVSSKSVRDSDGFFTEYTLYYNPQEDRYVCIFGDSDLYDPTNTEPDFECEEKWEAFEWFNDYVGPGEDEDDWMDEDVESSCTVTASENDTMNATQLVVWMYENYPDWAFYDEHELDDGRIMLKFEIGPKIQRADLEEDLEQFDIHPVFRNNMTIIAPEDPEYEGQEDITSAREMFLCDKPTGKYWYFTTHGVQPGSVPKGIEIEEVIDRPEGTYFSCNRVISTEGLKYYDLKERAPR